MGSYLDKPVTEKVSEDGHNDRLRYGASCMQGWRTGQEDAHNCILNLDPDTAFFAVYDGHGGAEVAVYTAKYLPDHLKRGAKYGAGHLEEALIDSFLDFDAHVASAEASEELREIARAKQEEEKTTRRITNQFNEDEIAAEESMVKLYREAEMPLEQVIQQYTCVKVQSMLKMQRMLLEAGKELESTEEGSSADEDGGGEGKGLANVVDEKVEGNGDEIGMDRDGQKAKADGDGVEDGVQVGESKHSNDVAQKSDKEEEKAETKQQNGDVRTGKGKASVPTKGVTPPQPTPKLLHNDGAADDGEEDGDERAEKSFTSSEQSKEGSDGTEEEEESDSDASGEMDDDDDDGDVEMIGGQRFQTDSPTEKPGVDSGCTAVVALLRGNQLLVANAGDSRCVVCRNGEAIEMSFDHKPVDKPEMDRVEKAGGHVNCEGRIQGGLNLSRAIGDHHYKQNTELSAREQMIIALPDVKTLTITPDVEFIVLACDGIWNSMSSQEVVDYVRPKVRAHPEKLSQICEELFDHCLAPDTDSDAAGCDNMTAIIVEFKTSANKRERSPNSDKIIESDSAKRLKTDDGKNNDGSSTTTT